MSKIMKSDGQVITIKNPTKQLRLLNTLVEKEFINGTYSDRLFLVFLLAVGDFFKGLLSLDQLSEICESLWWSIVHNSKEKEMNTLWEVLHAGGELSYYSRTVGISSIQFLAFHQDVVAFYHEFVLLAQKQSSNDMELPKIFLKIGNTRWGEIPHDLVGYKTSRGENSIFDTFQILIRLIIKNSDGKILTIKDTGQYPINWDLPGFRLKLFKNIISQHILDETQLVYGIRIQHLKLLSLENNLISGNTLPGLIAVYSCHTAEDYLQLPKINSTYQWVDPKGFLTLNTGNDGGFLHAAVRAYLEHLREKGTTD